MIRVQIRTVNEYMRDKGDLCNLQQTLPFSEYSGQAEKMNNLKLVNFENYFLGKN